MEHEDGRSCNDIMKLLDKAVFDLDNAMSDLSDWSTWEHSRENYDKKCVIRVARIYYWLECIQDAQDHLKKLQELNGELQ